MSFHHRHRHRRLLIRLIYPHPLNNFRIEKNVDVGKVAARQGFEPRLRVPKTPVLPLHHQATSLK